jgi:hypothetical protein
MRRLWMLAVLTSVTVLSAGAFAEEEGTGWEDLDRTHQLARERREYWTQVRDKANRTKKSEFNKVVAKLQSQKTELETTLESGLRKTGDVEYEAFEPDRPSKVVDRPPEDAVDNDIWIWDASADHFDYYQHDIWTLKPQDFRFWRPTRVMIEKPLGAREPAMETQFMNQIDDVVWRDVFLAVPFALKNSTNKERKIGPRMWLVSENLKFTEEIAGFIAKEDVERSMFKDLKSSFDLISYVKENPDGGTEPVQMLESGETRYGVGIFPLPDPEVDKLKLVVGGLNNTYRFDRRQKRVLVIEFDCPGDEFYPQEQGLTFSNREWQWMWMWYEELEASPPERFEFETPTGLSDQPKVHWAYQMTLTNHSEEPQAIKIRRVDTVVKAKTMGVEVEVPIIDDGRSTIYKTQVMEELAQPFSADRFFSGTLEGEQTKVFSVIFNVEDVDWDRVFEQVEAKLTGEIAIGYGEEELKPGIESFVPEAEKLGKVKRFELNDEQKLQIKEEVAEAIGPALEREQERRIISADVSAEAGIASGSFRVVRSYFKKGVVESNWIHQWSDFE